MLGLVGHFVETGQSARDDKAKAACRGHQHGVFFYEGRGNEGRGELKGQVQDRYNNEILESRQSNCEKRSGPRLQRFGGLLISRGGSDTHELSVDDDRLLAHVQTMA